jgi:uncharacterized protein (TIGR01244 family)
MRHKLYLIAIAILATTMIGCSTTLDVSRVGTARVLAHEEPINNLYRDGNFYFAGQPSEEGYRELAEMGITKVINLRPDGEYEDFPYNEPALVQSLGIEYTTIPFTLDSFSDADVDRFADELAKTSGKVLIHCSSSNRAGFLWALYLEKYRGYDAQRAIERGKAAGMTNEKYIEAVTSRLSND